MTHLLGLFPSVNKITLHLVYFSFLINDKHHTVMLFTLLISLHVLLCLNNIILSFQDISHFLVYLETLSTSNCLWFTCPLTTISGKRLHPHIHQQGPQKLPPTRKEPAFNFCDSYHKHWPHPLKLSSHPFYWL